MTKGWNTVLTFLSIFIGLFFLEISCYYDLGNFHFLWFVLTFIWFGVAGSSIRQTVKNNARRLLQENTPPTPSQLQNIAANISIENNKLIVAILNTIAITCAVVAAIFSLRGHSMVCFLFLFVAFIFTYLGFKQKTALPSPPKADPPTQLT